MPIHLRLRSTSSASQSCLRGPRMPCCSAVSSAHAGRAATAAFLDAACLAAGFAGLDLGSGCAVAAAAMHRARRASAARIILLLRRALLHPVLEPAIEVGVDRQVVGQQQRVDLLDFLHALVLLPGIDRAE